MNVRYPVALCALLALLALPTRADDITVAQWRRADAATQGSVLSLARQAFETFARDRDVIDPPAKLPALLRGRASVFVSAMRGGAPRCCMGTLYPTEPDAARQVIAAAAAAAGRDRRFRPVQPRELKSLTLIVSFVGAPRPIRAEELRRLDPLREGLVVRSGEREGVTLSCETDSVETMAAWARVRAGLSRNAPAEYYRIEVVRFVEQRPAREPATAAR